MSLKLFDLNGKTALVTGGTHGLGMAIAMGLANAGAKIVFNDISGEKVAEAIKQYKSQGVTAHGYIFDVTDKEAVRKNIKLIESEVAPIDILVNNAGIIKRVPILEMEVEAYRQVIDINLVGPFIVAQQVAASMVERKSGGKIINMCSMMSELGRDTVSAYAAAKGGLKMLTRNMATEWAKYNIQANAIGPGYYATSQTEPIRVAGNPLNEFIISRTPAGRWGEPDELQGAAIFLASAASDFVNGHVLYVDGGILATIGKPSNE
ncbi:MAG: gluconate 5-dehydrogenase [Bacteroidales bacterium]